MLNAKGQLTQIIRKLDFKMASIHAVAFGLIEQNVEARPGYCLHGILDSI